jgi:hypothetical protein
MKANDRFLEQNFWKMAKNQLQPASYPIDFKWLKSIAASAGAFFPL